MASANRQKIIVRQAPAVATGMFSIVVLLVGDVDSSRTVVLPARSSTVLLHRISAVLGHPGSVAQVRHQRYRKCAIRRASSRLCCIESIPWRTGETLTLRQRSTGESIDVAKRAHQDIARMCWRCPSLH